MRRLPLVLAAPLLAVLGLLSPIAAPPAGAVAGAPGATAYTTPRGALSVGTSLGCVVTAAGGAACWGRDSDGQAGGSAADPWVAAPTVVVGLSSGIAAVTAGQRHACALTTAGGVRCWGRNDRGQLGRGNTTPSTTPVNVTGLTSGVTALVAGDDFSCALTATGGVRCWGANDVNQLGDGTTTTRTTPVTPTGLSAGVRQLAAGGRTACALDLDGEVRCWGANSVSETGTGSSAPTVSAPTLVPNLGTTTRSVDVDEWGGCAVSTAGAVRCWGYGPNAGTVAPTERTTPTAITGLGAGVLEVAAGEAMCARMADRTLRCWGQSGPGSVLVPALVGEDVSAPTVVAGATDVAAVSAGSSLTCYLRGNGQTVCAGAWEGLGRGQTSYLSGAPDAISGLASGVSSVATGGRHACATLTAGSVRCWGRGPKGELGNATTPNSATPVAAGTIANASGGGAGDEVSCSINNSGGLRCFGANDAGQLGLGTTDDDDHPTPTVVPGLPAVAQVASGSGTVCAVTTGGALYCWGEGGFGKIGNGSFSDQSSPVAVPGLSTNVASVDVGSRAVCAVRTNGAVRCWGDNSDAQLGIGSTGGTFSSPQNVTGLDGTTSVSVGSSHACAVEDDAVVCWGSNDSSQVGPLGGTGTTVPVSTGLTGYAEVAVTAGVSCARSDAGAVLCWGDNYVGGLALDDATVETTTATTVLANGATDLDASDSSSAICAVRNGGVVCWGYAPSGMVGVDPGWTPTAVVGGATYFADGAAWAPHASWTAFVNAQYTDLTAVAPTSSNRTTWVTNLGNGSATPGDLIEALRATADNIGAVDPTARLYFAYFLRIPDKTGLDYWIGKKRGGMLLRTISDSFAASSEFQRRYGSLSNQEFVELIYQNLFQRPADASGLTYWTNKLTTGSESRGGVMAQFSESSEYKRKMASEVTVSVLNLLLLRRQVPQAEFDAAVARLDAPGMDTGIYAEQLLESSTYVARFS